MRFPFKLVRFFYCINLLNLEEQTQRPTQIARPRNSNVRKNVVLSSPEQELRPRQVKRMRSEPNPFKPKKRPDLIGPLKRKK